MRVPFRIVDVFTDRPFEGNQLCVVPDAGGLDEATMQRLAAEIGFSETTFVISSSANDFHMRIFTPTVELPFAGHPAIGTAFVLASEQRIDTNALQHVAAGDFRVHVDLARAFAEVDQHQPAFGEPVPHRAEIAEAAGLSLRDLHAELAPRVVSTGLAFLMVPLASDAAVRLADREPAALSRLLTLLEANGMYLFAVTGERKAHARMFDADLGIGEDAATGSAAGPLGAYLSEYGSAGMPGDLIISQGAEIGRPSTIHVRVTDEGGSWIVSVRGGVYLAGRGEFLLP